MEERATSKDRARRIESEVVVNGRKEDYQSGVRRLECPDTGDTIAFFECYEEDDQAEEASEKGREKKTRQA